ncbi:hypothetical protein [Streptococcus macacae]|uniref:Uncharacterized protein n=1 Tax=Streptococcus macacae NCTC 11558 TaxID=764298 RepID=G5JW21_9STRE|nr:hypothetical protein [Streptococcus macacae]EHJ52975.1 hypothetical protein STRMA_1434 [Streptococcus macacae NCTC 11558]SUN79354.1 Uncharacterised protein [Streptococcus macacae NCTC 11558]
MIGLNIVYEKDELLYSMNLSSKVNDNYSFDYFDFDNQSIDDFIDYLEFLEFEKYIFVALHEKNRLQRLADYLQENLECMINVVDFSALKELLSNQEIENLQAALEEDSFYQKTIALNTKDVFQNGFKAFRTGLYPHLTKGLLKHVSVDNLDCFLEKNQDLLRHFAINSAIYSDISSRENPLPVIIKSLSDFDTETFVKINAESLQRHMDHFVATGEIKIESNILDYGYLAGLAQFHSLIFENEQFYLDSAQRCPIGQSGDGYYKLFNEASLKLSAQDKVTARDEVNYLFPILVSIHQVYRDVNFITPYNAYHLKSIEEKTQSLNWIAFQNNTDSFVFNIQTGRLFKVNHLVIEKFEYIIKNKVSEPADQEMKQVREMLQTYG